jgi:hypothetical protein
VPVLVQRRCTNCHEMKPSSAFPTASAGRNKAGKLQRRYNPWCRDCLKANPRLPTQDTAKAYTAEVKDR